MAILAVAVQFIYLQRVVLLSKRWHYSCLRHCLREALQLAEHLVTATIVSLPNRAAVMLPEDKAMIDHQRLQDSLV